MLGPVVVTLVARHRWNSSHAASVMSFFGAAVFLLMAAFPLLPIFVAGSIIGMTATSAAIPLLTQIYHENYPERRRGKLFSRTIVIRIGVAASFSYVAGQVFSGRIEKFQILLLIFAAAFGMMGLCLRQIPSNVLNATEGSNPFRALRFAYDDRLFRRTLICWMLMGFANLMMIPMRVEMLANPKYGISMSVGQIALLTGVLPNLARIVLSPIWGWLFHSGELFRSSSDSQYRLWHRHSYVFYQRRSHRALWPPRSSSGFQMPAEISPGASGSRNSRRRTASPTICRCIPFSPAFGEYSRLSPPFSLRRRCRCPLLES